MSQDKERACKVTVTEEARGLVYGARNDDYGHPLDDFGRTAAMWSAILGAAVTAEQVALCMIAVKISRQCNRNKRDNLVDICGYAETLDMVIEERDRRYRLAEGSYTVHEAPMAAFLREAAEARERARKDMIEARDPRPFKMASEF